MKEIFVSGPRRRKSAHDAYLGWLVRLHQSNRSQSRSVCASVTVHRQRHTCRRYNIVVLGGDTSQTTKSGGEERASARTFPAASKPSINIRTSWSLLQRTSDEREVKREEKERPMSASGGKGERRGRAGEGGSEGLFRGQRGFRIGGSPASAPCDTLAGSKAPSPSCQRLLRAAAAVVPGAPPTCLRKNASVAEPASLPSEAAKRRTLALIPSTRTHYVF